MKIDIERLLCSLIECNTKSEHKYNWLADDIITSLRDQGLIYRDGQIIPELKESEDERIRKKLILFVQNWTKKTCDYKQPPHILWTSDKEECAKILAWLEKQGEQLKKHDVCDNCDQQGSCISPCPMKLVEKQGKQKPVEEYNITGIGSKHAEGKLGEMIKNLEPTDKAEPKFKAGDRVIGIVSGMQYYITEVCDDHYYTESGCTIMFYAQDNFELYKQKPTWSEEDERIFSNINLYIRKAGDYPHFDKENIKEAIKWLEFLKDRYTWKPSDEQMNALNYVVNLMASSERPTENDLYYNILKSLRQQLKKLKE